LSEDENFENLKRAVSTPIASEARLNVSTKVEAPRNSKEPRYKKPHAIAVKQIKYSWYYRTAPKIDRARRNTDRKDARLPSMQSTNFFCGIYI